jgi:hypothetical protein
MFEFDNHIANIFIFYLIITSNFFVPLLPCRAQSTVANSMLLRHIFGFLTMTFFVVLANTKTPLPFSKIIRLSLGLYIWFMISTRIRFDMWFVLVCILATMYILKVYKENSDDKLEESTKDTIERTESVLFFSAMTVTGLGALLYLGEKKIEYGKRFDLGKFVFGHVTCRGKSQSLGFLESLKGITK